MDSISTIIAILSFLLFFAASTTTAQNVVHNILSFGAKADGVTDNSKALSAAWQAACSSKTTSTVVIPKGTFLVGLVTLRGPCYSPINLEVQGTVMAPADPNALGGTGGWITICYVDRLTVHGNGVFDGQGQLAWKQNKCNVNSNCKPLPINLRFDFITNSKIYGITSLNSKDFHINVLGCKNVLFEHVTITAPSYSLNTDGIHIGRSYGVNITNSNIKTGDDCISMGDGSQNVRIMGVTCGPGHGISVGSLGRYPNEEPVSGIYVRNCTLSSTTNGVRIKSWPAMYGGSVSNMHFDHIFMKDVANPILIDQTYCPWNNCNRQSPSKVKISGVSFTNIWGTSTTAAAIQLSCSASFPCQNVLLEGINLSYNKRPAVSQCANVKPIFSGVVKPGGCGHP